MADDTRQKKAWRQGGGPRGAETCRGDAPPAFWPAARVRRQFAAMRRIAIGGIHFRRKMIKGFQKQKADCYAVCFLLLEQVTRLELASAPHKSWAFVGTPHLRICKTAATSRFGWRQPVRGGRCTREKVKPAFWPAARVRRQFAAMRRIAIGGIHFRRKMIKGFQKQKADCYAVCFLLLEQVTRLELASAPHKSWAFVGTPHLGICKNAA